MLTDGDHPCPSREAPGWLVFWPWLTDFESLPRALFFSAFFFSPESHPKDTGRRGGNRHEKNSLHLSRLCGEHKTTSALLTAEVCFSLIRRLRRKFYLDGFLLCSGDHLLQGDVLVKAAYGNSLSSQLLGMQETDFFLENFQCSAWDSLNRQGVVGGVCMCVQGCACPVYVTYLILENQYEIVSAYFLTCLFKPIYSLLQAFPRSEIRRRAFLTHLSHVTMQLPQRKKYSLQ